MLLAITRLLPSVRGQGSEHWGWRTADPPAEPCWHSCVLGQGWAGLSADSFISWNSVFLSSPYL